MKGDRGVQERMSKRGKERKVMGKGECCEKPDEKRRKCCMGEATYRKEEIRIYRRS